MKVGGIVVCGGQSKRMGRPKPWLPFAGEIMLPRVLRLLGEVVAPLVVVAAPGQDLPPLPADVRVVHDEEKGRGPLQGLSAGLKALQGQADAAYVSSCDVPFLQPAFVRRVIERLGDKSICVPHIDGFHHPLAAVYRIEVAKAVDQLLAEDRLRPVFLFDKVPTCVLEPADLIDVDPTFQTLQNLNTPEEYEAALERISLPKSWQEILAEESHKPYFDQLQQFVLHERQKHTVFPPEDDVFNAFRCTPFPAVKVLLLGQDPYHDDGQAHGLCFSVRPGQSLPPSLKNIFKELHNDLGCRIPNNGHLLPWGQQGVMLLNAVLTVRAHQANSHKDKGWETFTDAVIHKLNERQQPVVFVLWGAYARKKAGFIDRSRHTIIESAHPSPLSANAGFFGSRPFSKINAALRDHGQKEIDWQVPDA